MATKKKADEPPKKITTSQGLATRWRPKHWDDVCGHNSVVQRLKGIVRTQEVPNAILFTGPSGTGKTTLSRVFARYINCATFDACGECDSCLASDQGPTSHPDYQELDGASSGGIDAIRSLIQQASFMPTMGNLRIIMIDEAQMVTGAAQQALLKTLEEPPESTLFILSTMTPEKISPAIMGRCQKMELQRVGAEYVADHLAMIAKAEKFDKGLDADAMLLIAESTGGQLRDAIQCLDAVRQTMAGADGKLDADEMEEMVKHAIFAASGVTDDMVATKALVYMHAGKIAGKATLRGLLKAIINVQNPVSFSNALLFQNSYLIDRMVDPTSDKIYHTATNRQLVQLLNEKVDDIEAYGDNVHLGTVLSIHNHLINLRTQLVSAGVGGQDKALIQINLANAYSDARAARQE